MKTIKTLQNQTLYDVAVMYYGTSEAVGELILNNAELVNDPAALAQLGVDYINNEGFYPDTSLLAGQNIRIDTQSPNMNRNIVKEIYNEITTYGNDDTIN